MKKAWKYLTYVAIGALVAQREGGGRVRTSTEGKGVDPPPFRPRDSAPPDVGQDARKISPAAAPHGFVPVLKRTVSDFSDDDCMSLGAAVAYYTVFSLPPLLLLIISIAGMIWKRDVVQNQIVEEIHGLIGSGAAQQVQTMVKSAASSQSGSVLGLIFGILALIFGATGCFIALQDALNKAWHVTPDPSKGGVKGFIGKRLLSFGFIVGVGFLLLVSLAVSAALSAFGGWMAAYMPAAISAGMLHVAGELVSFGVITVMFAGMFKFLPDAKIEWRETWVGAAITALLFTVGKMLIGIYLGKSGATSAYGAAGSLMLIVLWLYYASLIFLFGAEFTKVWALSKGHGIEPEAGAVKVINEEHHQK